MFQKTRPLPVLYLAAGLFNAGERLNNLYLEKHLRALRYEIILPQREAEKFNKPGGHFDLHSVVKHCWEQCARNDVLAVVCVDGTDADSGAAIEFAKAMLVHGRAITYRTDFRTAPERELGMNAMFLIEGARHIYRPCIFFELDQVDVYYKNLADDIDLMVKQIMA